MTTATKKWCNNAIRWAIRNTLWWKTNIKYSRQWCTGYRTCDPNVDERIWGQKKLYDHHNGGANCMHRDHKNLKPVAFGVSICFVSDHNNKSSYFLSSRRNPILTHFVFINMEDENALPLRKSVQSAIFESMLESTCYNGLDMKCDLTVSTIHGYYQN